MLRKIDCIMIRAPDVQGAVKFYAETFGLRPLWQDEGSVGLGFPETDAETLQPLTSTLQLVPLAQPPRSNLVSLSVVSAVLLVYNCP